MNKSTHLVFITLIFFGICLTAGCQQGGNINDQLQPTELENSLQETQEVSQNQEENFKDPTVEPTAVIIPVAVDACLDCHMDKELLVDLAAPENEATSENEGEG